MQCFTEQSAGKKKQKQKQISYIFISCEAVRKSKQDRAEIQKQSHFKVVLLDPSFKDC